MQHLGLARLSHSGRYALSSCVAAAMLAGCGGSQPPIGVLGAAPQTSAVARHADRGKSWMLPEAKSKDLLYVSTSDSVYVFSYPKGTLVGTLTGFDYRGDSARTVSETSGSQMRQRKAERAISSNTRTAG